METFYKAYSKMVLNRKTYFVKKIVRFPEYQGMEDIVIGYGMHSNFNRACSIAKIDSLKIRERLLAETECIPASGKILSLYSPVKSPKKFIQLLQNSLSLLQLKLPGLYGKTAG